MSDFLVQMKRLFFLLTKADNGQKGGLASLDLDNFRKKLEALGVKIAYDEEVKWFTLLDVSGDGYDSEFVNNFFSVLDLLDWSHLKAFEYDLASLFILKNKKVRSLLYQMVTREL